MDCGHEHRDMRVDCDHGSRWHSRLARRSEAAEIGSCAEQRMDTRLDGSVSREMITREQKENHMELARGYETSGPSARLGTRESRAKRSPTGQTRAAEQPPITTGLHHHGVAWSGGRGHQHHPTRKSRQQANVRTLLAHQRVGANMAESGHRRGHDSSTKQSSSPSARAGITRHAHGAEFKRGEGARAQP